MFKSRKNKVIVIIIAALLFVGIGIFIFKSYTNRPQDLGPELEYIGKRHTGCPLPLPLGYLLMCSSEPGEEYYFGTDLSPEELEGYFTGTEIVVSEPRKYPQVERYKEGQYIEFRKKNITNFKGFRVEYYDNKDVIIERFNLKQTSKVYVISIPSDDGDYNTAKGTLR